MSNVNKRRERAVRELAEQIGYRVIRLRGTPVRYRLENAAGLTDQSSVMFPEGLSIYVVESIVAEGKVWADLYAALRQVHEKRTYFLEQWDDDLDQQLALFEKVAHQLIEADGEHGGKPHEWILARAAADMWQRWEGEVAPINASTAVAD